MRPTRWLPICVGDGEGDDRRSRGDMALPGGRGTPTLTKHILDSRSSRGSRLEHAAEFFHSAAGVLERSGPSSSPTVDRCARRTRLRDEMQVT